MKKTRRWIPRLLALVCAAVMVFSMLQLLLLYLDYKAGRDAYREIESYVVINTAPADDTRSADMQSNGNTEAQIQWSGPMVDFDSLRRINPDTAAWILGPGTAINYPVVQAENNEYYLNHLFDGGIHRSGSIFFDYRTGPELTAKNTIIYGHRMRDGSMFASLKEYTSQEYFEEHPMLWLVTPEGSFQLEVFSAYITDTSAEAWKLNFEDEEEYGAWIRTLLSGSEIQCGITPGTESQVVTLSTCSYEFEDARLVVHCVLRENRPDSADSAK